mmetsp:Transcript_22149/g.72916  ORF Transcript_22149/g.72916 Transcript_22149/m.72916 type:complete len:290 (-) Transcript_22149:1501-2370(-)
MVEQRRGVTIDDLSVRPQGSELAVLLKLAEEQLLGGRNVLPEDTPVVGVHGRTNGASEGLGEVRVLRHGPVDTEDVGTMLVRQDGLLLSLLPVLVAPVLSEADKEESLLLQARRSAVCLCVQVLPCSQRNLQPPHVCDVLPQRPVPIDVLARDLEVVVELLDAVRVFPEARHYRLLPPLPHARVRVELSPRVIEAMCELMSHHTADPPKVSHGLVGITEEGRLQHCCWHKERRDAVVVVCIYSASTHTPFFPVYLLVHFAEHVDLLAMICLHAVVEVALRRDGVVLQNL